MITQEQAEKFIQSKLALFMGMMFFIAMLLGWKIDDNKTISTLRDEIRINDSIHKTDLAKAQEVIHNIQEQQKIKDFNTAQDQLIQNEKDKERLERLIYVEQEARRLKIIK